MGVILSVSGLGMYRAMVQTNWAAMEREIESIAGTLHDSVEPLLPPSEEPTAVLQQIFPDLCLSDQPCKATPTLIQRHTIGISDRTTYYIRLFNHQGKLLAFSPNQPLSLPPTLNRSSWQTFRTAKGIRYHQFTTILHSANTHPLVNEASTHSSWGYLQIGRTLEHFDAEIRRIQWIMAIGLPIALSLVATSSWWLSGLAMQPIYQSYQQQQQFTANAAHELRSRLSRLAVSTKFLSRLYEIMELPLFPNMGLFSPILMHAIVEDKTEIIELYTKALKSPIYAANLCLSFRNQSHKGIMVTDKLFEQLIDKLLQNKGEMINRYSSP
jgi:two-component Ni(II)/redox sensor kinase NrsS